MKPTPQKQTKLMKKMIQNEDKKPEINLPAIKEDLKEFQRSSNAEGSQDMPISQVNIVQFARKNELQNTELLNLSCNGNIAKAIDLFKRLIEKELEKCAKVVDIEPEELQAWIDLQTEVPAKTILNLLRTAIAMQLDPLREEIGFTQYEDGNWQVQITIEGWVHILNQHPQFNGVTFSHAQSCINSIPEWIECSIYRKDRIFPITAREYYLEVKTDHAIWQKMPRRMLRHRSLQQCARLAIGLKSQTFEELQL